MLQLIQRSSFCSSLPRHSSIFTSRRAFGDRISDAYKSAAIRRPSKSSTTEGAGSYAVRTAYDQQVQSQRTRGADAESGVEPTKWQRRFLVLTRLYKRQSDIPQFVASATMNRLHDRMRVVYIIGIVCFLHLLYLAQCSVAEEIAHRRAVGVQR